MHDVQTADQPRLEMRWLPVTDDKGRTCMQSVWIPVSTAAPSAVHHAA
jgi:hypothetical protein